MISWVFCNVTTELGNLDFLFQFPLETCVHDLSLTRFQTITKWRNGSSAIGHWEKNEFFVDKVTVSQKLVGVINKKFLRVSLEPFFSFVSVSFIKGKHDAVFIFLVLILKLDLVLRDGFEVFFGFFWGWCSETLIVLDSPGLDVDSLGPDFIFGYCEESLNLWSFSGFKNRSDKLFDEAFKLD